MVLVEPDAPVPDPPAPGDEAALVLDPVGELGLPFAAAGPERLLVEPGVDPNEPLDDPAEEPEPDAVG